MCQLSVVPPTTAPLDTQLTDCYNTRLLGTDTPELGIFGAFIKEVNDSDKATGKIFYKSLTDTARASNAKEVLVTGFKAAAAQG